MSDQKESHSGWVMLLGIVLLVMGVSWYQNRPDQGGATIPDNEENPPVVTPSISGRWVSTEFANEVIELSPLGEVKITDRGQPFPITGTYRYSGGILKFTLNMPQGIRTVENSVTALSQGEMMMFLPRLIGVREERSVTYWRIDPESDSPLRKQLLGKWATTDGSGHTIECHKDDTFSRTLEGATSAGIFRVVESTLEYHVAGQQAPIAKFPIVSLTENELVLKSLEYGIDVRMVRVSM